VEQPAGKEIGDRHCGRAAEAKPSLARSSHQAYMENRNFAGKLIDILTACCNFITDRHVSSQPPTHDGGHLPRPSFSRKEIR